MKVKLEKKVKFQEKLISELQDQASAVQVSCVCRK